MAASGIRPRAKYLPCLIADSVTRLHLDLECISLEPLSPNWMLTHWAVSAFIIANVIPVYREATSAIAH